ncbi:MAG: dihydrofolate reductase [Halobacteriales archaeon]
MHITLIAAVAANGVIGADGEMPWHYPADLRHFKKTTMGHPVIMGRRTFESVVDRIDGPLPGRTSVVLTRRGIDPAITDGDVIVVASVASAVAAAEETGADVAYVVGGASVYEQFLPRGDRLVLTEIDEPYEGDTYFPEFDEAAWTETAREEAGDLSFVTYERSEGS